MKALPILATAASLIAATPAFAQEGEAVDDAGATTAPEPTLDEAVLATDDLASAETPESVDDDAIWALEPSLDQTVPVAEEPIADEPIAEEPIAEEPLAEESDGVADNVGVDEYVPGNMPVETEAQVAEAEDESVVDYSDNLPVTLPPDATDEDKLVYEFARYKQLMSLGVWDEADNAAKKVVELALRLRGAESNDFAKALTNLAIVQHQTQQYDAAQQNFESAIEIIEENEDRLNAQLVNPLKGLGASQMEGGRPDLAKDTFQRAVHVTHVNEGPHNLNQLFILESLSEADLRLGDIKSAEVIQDRIYAINRRMYPEDSIELVEPLIKRAEWQHRAGFINEERVSLRYAIRIIEAELGKNSLELVEPLLTLGRSYFYADMSGSQALQKGGFATGEIYFKRAQRIARETEEPDWRVTAQTSLALGDHYMFQGNDQRARKVYQELWGELTVEDDTERLDYRRAVLEDYITLSQRQLPQFVKPDPDAPDNTQEPALEGQVAIAYTISSRGRATRLKIIEAEPAEFGDMVRYAQRELRARVYRPKFVEAQPIDSDEQLLQHTFYYRQSDLDRVRAEREARRR